MSGLGLAELFDLEILARREKDDSEEVRRARHRELGKRLAGQGVDPADAGALLHGLVHLGDDSRRTPGQSFAAALRGLHTLVAIAGLLLGAGLSLSLLHYSGGEPVNILNALAALVVTQIALLALLLLAMIPRSKREPGIFQGALLGLLKHLLRRVSPDTDPKLLDDLVHRLDSHAGLLRWLLVRCAQIFGVSFNVAALAGCFYRITFSDIAFSWSTTLALEPAALHRVTSALSRPWAWLIPQGVPSLSLIEHTQYSHFDAMYFKFHGSRILTSWQLGGWWPFLLCALAGYGLMPRMLVLALSELRIRRILHETPARNETFRRIVEGMTLPVLSTRTEGPDGEPFVPPGEIPGQDPALPPAGSACVAIVDDPKSPPRELLDRLVRDRFGWTISSVLTPQDLEAGGANGSPVLVVLSAWEEPTKGHQRRFLALRKADPSRLIVVGLHDPSPQPVNDGRLEKIRGRWKRHLRAALGDQPLRVESLGRPA